MLKIKTERIVIIDIFFSFYFQTKHNKILNGCRTLDCFFKTRDKQCNTKQKKLII